MKKNKLRLILRFVDLPSKDVLLRRLRKLVKLAIIPDYFTHWKIQLY